MLSNKNHTGDQSHVSNDAFFSAHVEERPLAFSRTVGCRRLRRAGPFRRDDLLLCAKLSATDSKLPATDSKLPATSPKLSPTSAKLPPAAAKLPATGYPKLSITAVLESLRASASADLASEGKHSTLPGWSYKARPYCFWKTWLQARIGAEASSTNLRAIENGSDQAV